MNTFTTCRFVPLILFLYCFLGIPKACGKNAPLCFQFFFPVVEAQARLYLDSGIRNVFVGGTTGEFASLSLDERMALTQQWCEVADGSIKVAVHVGYQCAMSLHIYLWQGVGHS